MKIAPTNYILQTDAASEPISLSTLKEFLRIDGTDYDDILTPMIRTARQLCERITGRDMILKTWDCYLDNFSFASTNYNNLAINFIDNYFTGSTNVGIEILKSRLQSITSIQYYVNDVLVTFSSSNYYFTNEDEYSTIYLKEGSSWPTTIDNRKQAVKITFVSGYGSSSTNIPQALREGMLYHIAAMFQNAGDCKDCENELYKKFYAPYKISKLLFSVV